MGKYKWNHPILDVIKMGIAAAPGLLMIIITYAIVSAIVPALQIIYVAKFINNVIGYTKHDVELNFVIINAVIIVLIIAYQWISDTLIRLVWIRFENKLRINLTAILVEKRANLEYEYIENEETWNLLKRVSEQPETKICSFFETIIRSSCLMFRIISIVVALSYYVWWEGIFLVIVAIPLMWLSLKSGEATYKVKQEVTDYERKCNYLTEVMLNREYAQERTLFGYYKFVNDKWKKQYKKSSKLTVDAYRAWYAKLEMGSIFTAILLAITIVVILVPTIDGIITIGMFISLTNSCFSLIDSMSWEFREYIDKLTECYNFIKEMAEVAFLKEKEGSIRPRNKRNSFNCIEFVDVSFNYPNSEKKVLDHISFKIDEGTHYAIVGKNGEGKSTIIKLLSGLYTDYTGKILIDGVELRNYDYSDLKGILSIVYQDFGKYELTMRDNLLLANSESTDSEMRAVLEKFELGDVVKNMPKGIDTPLGKIQHSSVELSGGEWQRVALARTYIYDAPVYLLDEPTAALDPLSECQVYQDFQKASENKTTILISHRLGSVKMADIILVLDKGKIVESGSHDDLIKNKHLYYEMYESQRSWYQ